MTEGEMVGWHHRLNGHEFEQAPEDGEGRGSLACCSPWGRKELDSTEKNLPRRRWWKVVITGSLHKAAALSPAGLWLLRQPEP